MTELLTYKAILELRKDNPFKKDTEQFLIYDKAIMKVLIKLFGKEE